MLEYGPREGRLRLHGEVAGKEDALGFDQIATSPRV